LWNRKTGEKKRKKLKKKSEITEEEKTGKEETRSICHLSACFLHDSFTDIVLMARG
jgi:hypothetical protein